MDNFYTALISALIVSMISLTGIIFIFFRKSRIEKILFVLVAFAAGTLIGNSFFHLIPESLEKLNFSIVFFIVFLGFLFFYLIELFFHWHHPHKNLEGHSREHKHFSYLNLIGDGFHNFVDGILIAVSYSVSLNVGLVVTATVVAHEIPQEIGDFAILIYGGFTKIKALLFNLLSALFAIAGVVFFGAGLFDDSYAIYFLPLIAGGFLYISIFDLIPELHRSNKGFKKTFFTALFLILGIIFMYVLNFIFH